MIATRSILILGAFAVLTIGSPVSAADLGGSRGGSIKDDMPVLMQQSAARFYVRADGSYANYDKLGLSEAGQFDLINAHIDGNWSVGGGIGYYFNRNIRADLTIEERFKTNISGTNGDSANFGDGATRNFGLKSEVYLANLYYDFDGHGRFTPYVGVGLGVAQHHVSGGTYTDGSTGCVATCTSLSGTFGNSSNTVAAAALMTGVAINLTGRGEAAGSGYGYGGGEAARNLYLDLGYRFLYMGEASTGGPSAFPLHSNPIAASGAVVADALHAHEFRVGLRYDFH